MMLTQYGHSPNSMSRRVISRMVSLSFMMLRAVSNPAALRV